MTSGYSVSFPWISPPLSLLPPTTSLARLGVDNTPPRRSAHPQTRCILTHPTSCLLFPPVRLDPKFSVGEDWYLNLNSQKRPSGRNLGEHRSEVLTTFQRKNIRVGSTEYDTLFFFFFSIGRDCRERLRSNNQERKALFAKKKKEQLEQLFSTSYST